MRYDVATIRALFERGMWWDEIAAQVGCSVATVRRALAGPAVGAGVKRVGRPSVADTLPEAFIGRVAARVSAAATRAERTTVPLHFFAEALRDPGALPTELFERIRRDGGRHLPEKLQAVVLERCPDSVQQWIRGPKHRNLNISTTRRSLVFRDWDGIDFALRAGDVITADDAHFNQGFYSVCPRPVDRCSERFGVRAWRAQNLVFADVATGRVLFQAIVLRNSDAYNQRDIRWCLARLLRAVGLPRLWFFFEHGAWAARELEEAARMVGCGIRHAGGSKSKGLIEAKFDIHQTLMAAELPGLNLGRTRDFDFNGREWCAIRDGRRDPRDCGYMNVEDFFRVSDDCWSLINARRMDGRLYQWVPDAEWDAQRAADKPLRVLGDKDFSQMMPERRKVSVGTKVQGSLVLECTDAGGQVEFRADFLQGLRRGYNTTVCFDPLEPERAAVFNAQTGAAAVTRGRLCEFAPELRDQWTVPQLGQLLAEGEFIGWASRVEATPMFNDHARSARETLDVRKQRRGFVRRMAAEIRRWGQKRTVRTDEYLDATTGDAARVVAPGDARLSAMPANFEAVVPIAIDAGATREARVTRGEVAGVPRAERGRSAGTDRFGSDADILSDFRGDDEGMDAGAEEWSPDAILEDVPY